MTPLIRSSSARGAMQGATHCQLASVLKAMSELSKDFCLASDV